MHIILMISKMPRSALNVSYFKRNISDINTVSRIIKKIAKNQTQKLNKANTYHEKLRR